MADLPRHAADDGVTRARRRRMRSVAVGVGVTVVVAAVLVDRETEPDYAAVCVDPDTQERVDDDQCREEHHAGVGSAFAWYYLGRQPRPRRRGGGHRRYLRRVAPVRPGPTGRPAGQGRVDGALLNGPRRLRR